MKVGLAVIVLLATAQLAAGQTGIQVKTSLGRCENPMFKRAVTEIKVLDKPIKYTGSTCGSLWRQNGVCCDVESLKTWVEKDKESLDNAGIEFSRLINELNDKLDSLNKTDLDTIKNNHLAFLEKIREDKKAEEFQAKAHKCKDYLKKVRSGSLCSLCSSRFKESLNGNRSVITLEDCKTLISSCGHYYLEIGFFLQGVRAMFDGGLLAKCTGTECDQLREIDGHLRSDELETLVTLLSQNLARTGYDDDSSRQMCEMSFNLVKPTVFQLVRPVIHYVVNDLSYFLEVLKKSKHTLRVPSNQSRQLASNQCRSHGNILKSDSTVLRNALDNEDILKGQKNNMAVVPEAGKSKALNLTLEFP